MSGEVHPSADLIKSAQLEALRNLLGSVAGRNAFYRAKFAQAGVDARVASPEDFAARFPFTEKGEIVADQRAHPPFGTNLTFPVAAYSRYHQTSGTTGFPLRWLDTPESWRALMRCWQQVYRAAGVTASDRILFAFSFGPFLGFWLAFDAAQELGCLCLPGGGLGSVGRLKLIFETQATVLCCTPTYAIRLAEAAAAEKLDMARSPVRIIIVAGEAGGSLPSTRAHLERLWPGARVFDHHGMTEVGPVTYECPARPCRLHVMEHAFLAEIVDPETLRAVAPGATGELVLTTLLRDASPLIRYRTGDLVRAVPPGPPCACGRSELALEGGILGRSDDMVVIRGVNIYPSAVEEIIRTFPEVSEYRVTVATKNGMPEMSLEAELEGVERVPLKSDLEKALQAAFSLRVPVALLPPGTLPRSEMKAKRWVRS